MDEVETIEHNEVSFNIGFLKESAKNLADLHSRTPDGKEIRPVLSILNDSKSVLEKAYSVLTGFSKTDQELSPAAEWLIDNFYIVQEQIIQVKIDFPKEFQKSIPVCGMGDYKGLPKVYELILNYLTHTDNLMDTDNLLQYIKSYQQVETLMQGEVWAIPIMIRLILIQRLAQKASRIIKSKSIKLQVQDFITKLENRQTEEPGVAVNMLSEWYKSAEVDTEDPLYLIEVYNQLQTTGNLYDEEKRWFNYRFRQLDLPYNEAVRIEAQKQSRLQVSIQNAVISLRHAAELEWSDFAEECSIIEKILQLDPSGYYPKMDFQTRDMYRKTVERLSRQSNYTESEVAEQVLRMVEEAGKANSGRGDAFHDGTYSNQHIGYFLLDEGYSELITKLRYKKSIREKLSSLLLKQTGWYMAAIILHTILLMGIIWLATNSKDSSLIGSIAVTLVALFPAMDLSVTTVNRFFAFFLAPRILPKLSLKEEIPDKYRTLIVVPTILTSPADVKRQVENLEIRSLANPEKSLQLCLLSDFSDAQNQNEESDELILTTAIESIRELNKKYSSIYGNKFYLLHRERKRNESEGIWMGWERKRGKLEEFNRLLIDPTEKTSFKFVEGDFFTSVSSIPVQYVITLDSDTKLPPESAKHLIRTIAHPLNRAFYDDQKKRITKGYGIIQPRISISPESARKTWFTRIFSGNVGLDPYSTSVSDIYQDLAAEAVFTGKGIYDVKAFHRVLDHRFPENRILSHDLIESTYLRAGLATDIELFDDYPFNYVSFTKRNHRWTRGDWQIASWLFRKVPTESGKEINPINRLSKWKIFDNLRRSLNPFFMVIFFLSGWFILPGSAWVWTAAAFGILAFPIYVSLSADILNRPERVKWKLYFDKVRANLKLNTVQSIFTVMIIPHQAMVQLDAIFRTFYRLLISRKMLLEWTTATQVESGSKHSLNAYFKNNLISIFLGVFIIVVGVNYNPNYLWIIIPFFLIWTPAPVYLWYVSQPIVVKRHSLSDAEIKRLRIYARKTWYYFERFVNEDHFWLPPDNYQEDPPIPLAERTSPTNIGLALVSTQVAYNMGYITLSEHLCRLLNTLHSIQKLERYKGHYYNWYETRLGGVLNPRYVSTVDSGNLAASLIVVREAVKSTMNQRGANKVIWTGLEDTILAVKEIFSAFSNHNHLSEANYKRIEIYTSSMLNKLMIQKNHLSLENGDMLKSLKVDATALCSVDIKSLSSKLDDNMMQDLLFWLETPLKLIEKMTIECKLFSFTDEELLEKYSPNELINLLDKDSQNSSVCKHLESWKNQSVEIQTICDNLLGEMDFSFLYLKKRGLFSIGYNVDKASLDTGTYDLLASEARIASYIAIAKGEIPVEHWFRLARRLTSLNRNEILISWGGTMFEYLMPLLFIRSYPDTLLHHTVENVIEWQKEYGRKMNRPWGFSESAYNFLNIDLHYQYRAFGAPGLGLKRGLSEEYVVAPYASLLSLMVAPELALKNLKALEKIGASGLYGFYDSVDYTKNRLAGEGSFKVVKTYMVHHHGMSLIAIENLLNNWSVQNYFHSDPAIKSCELILQEKVPRGVPVKEPHPVELESVDQKVNQHIVEHAGINELDAVPPRLHLLSNGNYSLFLTHAGTGASRNNDILLNGWVADPVSDPLGLFFYIRDTETGRYWSAMHQPVKRKPDRYDSWFHNGKVVTSRVDDWIETTSSTIISPDYAMEFRKICLTNYSQEVRSLDVTSYAEVVLNREADHYSHPAFSKLFIQTDYLAEHHAIIVKRRPRKEGEKELWMVHTFAGEEHENLSEPLQFETDRGKFIGRGNTLSAPLAMVKGQNLEGTLGNVSDPIVSLRKKITLAPGEKAEFTFGLGFANSREEAVKFANMFDNRHATDRAFDMASIYSLVELHHLDISSKQAHFFQKLTSHILYANPMLRSGESIIRGNRKKQQDLWGYGISGDMPLIVFRLNEIEQLKSVRHLLKAHNFWKQKGIETELIFINDHAHGYIDEIQEAIIQQIQTSSARESMNKRGGIFVHRSDKMSSEDLNLMLTVAHAVFEKQLPDLKKINKDLPEPDSWLKAESVNLSEKRRKNVKREAKQQLMFFNEFGGFNEKGDEYQIIIKPDKSTGKLVFPPSPWINVIANPDFGFIASEKGSGYTWSENSRENKLTGWSNDPVSDPHSEAFYIRDEVTKEVWSPMPGPVPGKGEYLITHGFGYTKYVHDTEALREEVIQFVPQNGAVKISTVTIQNNSERSKRISVYHYQERVLGVNRNQSSRYVIQDVSENGRTIFSTNHYNNEFAGRTVFASVVNLHKKQKLTYTTSRENFIGRNRTPENPIALERESLANSISTAEDPCVAFRIEIDLDPKETISFSVLMGETNNRSAAEKIIKKYSETGHSKKELNNIKKFWSLKLGKIQISTPDTSMNILMNGWLMYQNISCRMWARTAFYQAGGAYGFRDQLQDAMAAFYFDPEITRNQILLHSEKQFHEGDALHWWHPPTGRGIRSKITDDRLWLPYVTNFYIRSSGDESILDEQVSYITARTLASGEHEVYLLPEESKTTESVYEHCCRAIEISLQFGSHGLPLIGSGDWNDGMNSVGEHGKGESVWLGFFIYIILERFEKICKKRGDYTRADHFKLKAQELKNRLNTDGWDGNWYLRAFYDDGTPLGSASNTECRIDAISQAWAVISGVATKVKADKAIAAAEKHLVSEQDRIIRLLTPPFDRTDKNPGYIKGYIPGVRENGGQYTHAALWLIKAMAETGSGHKAASLFNMINPINHSFDKAHAMKYKVEPYVVAADVYGEQPLTGTGGWSWYTGSGGWMYRVGLESILGFRQTKGAFTLQPSIPPEWKEYNITFKPDESTTEYQITIKNPEGLETGVIEGTSDEKELHFENGNARIPIKRDGGIHKVILSLKKRITGIEKSV